MLFRYSFFCILLCSIILTACLPEPVEISGDFPGVGAEIEDVVSLDSSTPTTFEGSVILKLSDDDLPVFFGRINQIEVLEDGSFIAFDTAQVHILLFDKEGNFVEFFGDEGEGPGSFSREAVIKVYDGNIYVFDRLGYKIDVFTHQNGSWTYTKTYTLENIDGDRPDTLIDVNSEFFSIRYRHNRTRQGKTFSVSHLVQISKQSPEDVQTWLVEYPPINLFFEDLGGFWASYPGPFTPLPVVGVTSNSDIISARTDLFRFLRSDSNGNPVNVTEKIVEPLPLTPEQKQNVSGFADRIMDLVQENMPDFRPPVINRIFPDNENNLWAGYINENESYQEWLLINEHGGSEKSIRFDLDVQILNYKNGLFYGLIENQEGVMVPVVIGMSES